MPTPVSRLFEAHLSVADLDRSVAFYRDRLGLELAQVIPSRQVAFFSDWLAWPHDAGVVGGRFGPAEDNHAHCFCSFARGRPGGAGGVANGRHRHTRLRWTADKRSSRDRLDAGGVSLFPRPGRSSAGCTSRCCPTTLDLMLEC